MKPVTHFWHQRLSAILLLFLLPWFSISLIVIPKHTYEVLYYFSRPFAATGLFLFVFALLYHCYLGVSTIIEDYVPSLKMRSIFLQMLQLKIGVIFVFCSVCLIRILVFGGKL